MKMRKKQRFYIDPLKKAADYLMRSRMGYIGNLPPQKNCHGGNSVEDILIDAIDEKYQDIYRYNHLYEKNL